MLGWSQRLGRAWLCAAWGRELMNESSKDKTYCWIECWKKVEATMPGDGFSANPPARWPSRRL